MPGDEVEGQRTADDRCRHIGEAPVVISGETSESVERFIHVDATALGDHALCLFDHDPAVEGVLQVAPRIAACRVAWSWTIAMLATSANAWASTVSLSDSSTG